ncbi:MAG: class B sortase [Oscillospiraceae bacterium]|nr:class B sortase [Oscillospiraceae bacterium]
MQRFWKALNALYAWCVILAFGIVTLVGVWQMYDNYYLFSHAIDSGITRYKPVPGQEAAEPSPITDEMVAWITLDGTGVDFPVMQGEDNYEFLNKDPYGDYSLSGSVFLDCRSSPDFTDDFSMIYGHHMDYGRLFGALDAYLDEDYFREHTAGTLTIGRNAEQARGLRVFAVMRTNAREKILFDLEQENVRQFIHDQAELLSEESGERIIALSTCADSDLLARVVVFCYITEDETNQPGAGRP